jgi:CBS domain-containing protein
MEQTLLTDQDNFIAYDDAAAAAGKRGWFQRFAERVNEDLESAGFPRCPGGHMARNHHATLTEWRRRFDACVDDPSAHEAELWFDFRPVGGHLDVAPLEAAMGRARRAPLLLRSLADEALGFGPPAALLLRVRGGTVNLKTHGITPIVFLARCHALEIGSPARSTTARLDAALQAGLLSAETHALVSEAFRFLLGLRLRVQLRALDAPRPVSNEVALADLGPVERSRLKDAFRAIRTWQTEAGQHYHAGGT